jgi:hypothetical protein
MRKPIHTPAQERFLALNCDAALVIDSAQCVDLQPG